MLAHRRASDVERDLRARRLVSSDSVDLHAAWHRAIVEAPDDATVDASLEVFDVAIRGEITYPSCLEHDVEAPAAVFWNGDITVCDAHPRVAVVGTRRATEHGRGTARELGRELANHGVSVVSGLALGIDAATHRGVLDVGGAPPIAVVASGLDVVYPRANAELWRAVAERGVVLSESPPGAQPDRHRFPLRNRIIAALAQVLVVVESRAIGGSMITVNEALARDVPVMAVPGATRSWASEGTNTLLRDGALVAATPSDVLVTLGLSPRHATNVRDLRAVPLGSDRLVLAAIGPSPMSLDDVTVACAPLTLGEVALGLGRLEAQGWVVCTDGWFERAYPGYSVL